MKSSLFRSLVFTSLLVSSMSFALPRVIIENVTIIDASSLVRDNMTVVVQGDVIDSVEKTHSQINDKTCKSGSGIN